MLSRIKSTSLFVYICKDFMEHCWLMPVKQLSAIYDERKSEFWVIRSRVSFSSSFIFLQTNFFSASEDEKSYLQLGNTRKHNSVLFYLNHQRKK